MSKDPVKEDVVGTYTRVADMLSERDKRIRLLEDVAEAALEVWRSVPASRDESDPTVWRHALALNALFESLKAAGYEVEP